MEKSKIGSIEIIKDIRLVWPKEDINFTPWLCEHISEVGRIIGKELVDAQKETSTGNFWVDIVAKDDEGNSIIIENQFGTSDHDHLGKLLTYASSISDVKAAVWIVEQARMEHVEAINALNKNYTDCDFYLVKIQAIKIDESKPAPLFTKIAGPDESTESMKSYGKQDAEKIAKQQAFWKLFVNACIAQKFQLFSDHGTPKGCFITGKSGIGGITYNCWAFKDSVRVELKFGKDSKEENRAWFKKFAEMQNSIEKDFGDSLVWLDDEDNKMCSIRKDYKEGGIDSDDETKEKTVSWCIDNLRRLEMATKKFLK